MPQTLLWQDALPFLWYVVNRINSFLIKVQSNVKEEGDESEGEGAVKQEPAEVAERPPRKKKPFRGFRVQGLGFRILGLGFRVRCGQSEAGRSKPDSAGAKHRDA